MILLHARANDLFSVQSSRKPARPPFFPEPAQRVERTTRCPGNDLHSPATHISSPTVRRGRLKTPPTYSPCPPPGPSSFFIHGLSTQTQEIFLHDLCTLTLVDINLTKLAAAYIATQFPLPEPRLRRRLLREDKYLTSGDNPFTT